VIQVAIVRDVCHAYFDAHIPEKQLAERFDEAFDISYGASETDFSFWFARPKTHTTERFGLQREVLVVYQAQAKVDARFFAHAKEVLDDGRFEDRLDQLVVFLVHRADPEKVRDLVVTSTDFVTVPVQASELMNPARGSMFLRTLMSTAIGDSNLFEYSSPITRDVYFFGRDDLVRQLYNRAVAGESSGVFGLRKTGKTSVLFALRRMASSTSAVALYVDFQNPGVHAQRWFDLLHYVATLVASEAKERFDLDIPCPHQDYSERNAGRAFAECARAVLAGGGAKQLILMFDEIEYITPGVAGRLASHWDDDFGPFWSSIRGTAQQSENRVTFIVAGVNPVAVTRGTLGTRDGQVPNPVFQTAVPFFMEPLEDASIRKMVRTMGRYAGLSFDEEVYSHLRRAYGGHPYLIRLACGEIWKSVAHSPETLARVTLDTFELRRTAIMQRLAAPIRDILLSLVWWYPEEYDLLRILADGDAKFVVDYISDNPNALQFARYGLVDESTGAFQIRDVQDFLRDHGEEYKSEFSPFARSEVSPNLLPSAPNIDLLSGLFVAKARLEAKLRNTIVLFLGTSVQFDAGKISCLMMAGLDTKRYSLFIGRSPQAVIDELYINELTTIMLRNWGVFGPLFSDRRVEFMQFAKLVNVARRIDGHTKPITQKQADDAHAAYAWFMNALEQVPDLSLGSATE
jgi:hypothetical protein